MAQSLPNPLQFINEDGKFSDNLQKWIMEYKFHSKGLQYNVATILGSQSSGKSTLLNALYGTNFCVMNSQKGHSQTTQGIWVAADTKLPSTLILDVEGTDSKERGDDRIAFENQAALFCLSVSDCVIINIWYTSLGNYTASNFSLLKTVIEVDLDLFKDSEIVPKTNLLFVVRDWSQEATDLKTLQDGIQHNYIEAIWKDIRKPPKFAKSKIKDFFNIETVGLAHGLMQKTKFLEDVNYLRNKILKLQPKTFSREIPSDGFALYCQNIWNTISSHAQINIPSQKIMLSNFRCQEIKNSVLNEAQECLKYMKESCSKQYIPDFVDQISSLLKAADGAYVDMTNNYDPCVCRDVYESLIEHLCSEIQLVSEINYSHSLNQLIQSFKKSVGNIVTHSMKLSNEEFLKKCMVFSDWCEGKNDEIHNEFNDLLEPLSSVILSHNANISLNSLSNSLSSTASLIMDAAEKDFVKELNSRAKDFINQYLKNIDGLLIMPEITIQSFWTRVINVVGDIEKELYEHFVPAWGALGQSEPDQKTEMLVTQCRDYFKNTANSLDVVVKERFEALFNNDENGQPREWTCISHDSLSHIFVQSKTQAFLILKAFNEFENFYKNFQQLQSFSVITEFSKPLLNEALYTRKEAEALKKIQYIFSQAQIIQKSGGLTVSWRHIPVFFWIILLAVSWNEISYVFGLFFSLRSFTVIFVLLTSLTYIIATNQFNSLVFIISNISHFIPIIKSLFQKTEASTKPKSQSS